LIHATALYVDGPCRLQTQALSFDVQPPEFLTCKNTRYIMSTHQGLQYINYVVQGGPNDTGATGLANQRDVFQAWNALNRSWNYDTREALLAIRRAGQKMKRRSSTPFPATQSR
jgi:hypothetical protein